MRRGRPNQPPVRRWRRNAGAAPVGAGETAGGDVPFHTNAKAVSHVPVGIPACILVLLATLTGMAVLIVVILNLPAAIEALNQPDPAAATGPVIGPLTASWIVVLGFLMVFVQMGVGIGGVMVMRRYSFSSARATAVMACIPFISPGAVLGIPFGVWLLKLLKEADPEKVFRKR